jgi:MHS family shikimate/dehydroshikimate transporter-like MFS transporter
MITKRPGQSPKRHGNQTAPPPASAKRAIASALLGTITEWFDYALFGAASGIVINRLFFPDLSEVNGVLAAFSVFAVGFFSRPLGGVIISHVGDRFGRKPALIPSVECRP